MTRLHFAVIPLAGVFSILIDLILQHIDPLSLLVKFSVYSVSKQSVRRPYPAQYRNQSSSETQ